MRDPGSIRLSKRPPELCLRYFEGRGSRDGRLPARELASAKNHGHAVAPGPIESVMTATFPDRLRSLIPLGRMGTPREVASAVLFLATRSGIYSG